MIDPKVEELISLSDAAKCCPRRRRGKQPHVSCLYRWSQSGCKGVVLETIQVGGTRCTSREALFRFFDQLTALAHRQTPLRQTTTTRRRAVEDAESQLKAAGIY